MAFNDERYAAMGGEGMMKDRFDPLLVCLHSNMVAYSEDRGSSDNVEQLIHSVVAVLDAQLSGSERILAADVLISLIKEAEQDLCKSLSEKLAHKDNLPDSLLYYLANNDIDIARPVLKFSSLLSDTDLQYIIESHDENHWEAIAEREYLSTILIESLVEKKNAKADVALLKNNSIELSEKSLRGMLPVVGESNTLAEEIMNYKSLPRDIAVNLYWHISIALRDELCSKFKIKDADINDALEDCVQDFTDTLHTRGEDFIPSHVMIEAAEFYSATNQISGKRLIDCLRRRHGRFFVAIMAAHTQLDFKTINKMMRQKGGQGMAIACRATNLEKEDFVSIFLLSRAIACPNIHVQADELKMAIRYYEGLTLKSAYEILKKSIS